MKSTFENLPKPRAVAVPDPDMSKLDAIACQVPSRSMPESEATPLPAAVAAPEVTPEVVAAPAPDVAAEVAPEAAPATAPVAAEPEKAADRRVGPDGTPLVQLNIRLPRESVKKFKMHCLARDTTMQDYIIELIERLE